MRTLIIAAALLAVSAVSIEARPSYDCMNVAGGESFLSLDACYVDVERRVRAIQCDMHERGCDGRKQHARSQGFRNCDSTCKGKTPPPTDNCQSTGKPGRC
jgi:hypothetical protein